MLYILSIHIKYTVKFHLVLVLILFILVCVCGGGSAKDNISIILFTIVVLDRFSSRNILTVNFHSTIKIPLP